MQKQKKEKKRVKKKNGGELAYQEEFFFEGRGGALALARARSYLGRPGDPPGITRPQLYKYIRASRARIRSFLGGVSPGVCAVCFLGRLAPFAALALVLFSSLFFFRFFWFFSVYIGQGKLHRAVVGVFFWFG